jgi:hypothetical protein
MMITGLRQCAAAVVLSALALVSLVAAGQKLDMEHIEIPLPGAPTVVLPADMNRDGMQDLVLAVAYTEWDQIGIDELTEMREVEGLVMVMTVVPVVMDRREIRVYLGREGGGYADEVLSIPIDLSVLSMDHGPDSSPVILLTDTGVSALRLRETATGSLLEVEALVEDVPVLARSGALIPHLGLSRDLDDDGDRDLLFPVNAGLDVYLAPQLETGGSVADQVELPGDRTWARDDLTRFYPLPVVRDVNGDRLPDLLVPDLRRDWDGFQVLVNLGKGEFDEAFSPLDEGAETDGLTDVPPSSAVVRVEPGTEPEELEKPRKSTDEERFPVVHFGDLDGDGVAEYVTEESLEDDDAGWRKEVKEAKRPPRRYRIHRSRSDLRMQAEPFQTFEALGYALDMSDEDIRLPAGFQDLDGDGRQDLITLTLDFSLFQAVRIMTTQRIGIGLDFHVFCQDSTGQFREVRGMDLSGKFKLNLKNLQVGQFSQFAGDFDGDGLTDFLQIGRGKTVTIHRGQKGCRYPSTPDLTLKLRQPPLDLGLVRVEDLNADGRSDLMIVQPDREPEPGVSAPVRLDLYLSEGNP